MGTPTGRSNRGSVPLFLGRFANLDSTDETTNDQRVIRGDGCPGYSRRVASELIESVDCVVRTAGIARVFLGPFDEGQQDSRVLVGCCLVYMDASHSGNAFARLDLAWS